MREKDRFLKKQIDLKIFIILFFFIFFSKNLFGEDVVPKIVKYVKSLDNFSSKFIQSNGNTIDEGFMYVKDKKIRLDYVYPKRTLILSERKGVYINHDLKEEEFFSTKNNIVSVFYQIFLDDNFFSKSYIAENKEQIIFEKNIVAQSNQVKLKVFFENRPLLLRKILISSEKDRLSISFSDHNYENIFDEGFFSFVPIYLD